MMKKLKGFVQHLYHDIEDEETAEQYLDETLPLIGVVVMYFNYLEKSVDSAICFMLSDRSDTRGLLVLHGMAYGAKVEMFKRLCDDYHSDSDDTPASYPGLHEALKEMGNLRNLVVHADWYHTDEEGYVYVKAKISATGIEQEYVQLTAASLETIIERISATDEKLSLYLEQRDEQTAKRYQTASAAQ
jgi:hypothetical protein